MFNSRRRLADSLLGDGEAKGALANDAVYQHSGGQSWIFTDVRGKDSGICRVRQ
jgi:hypothetical protein